MRMCVFLWGLQSEGTAAADSSTFPDAETSGGAMTESAEDMFKRQ